MENTKEILLKNLTGKDLEAIGNIMDCSTSKIIKCLKGTYNNDSEIQKILDAATKYFVTKYKTLIVELENAKLCTN